MFRRILLLCWAAAAGPLHAMGMNEDPQEKLTKTWRLEEIKSLEFRGEVEFELVPGPGLLTIETSRALFDQLTVSNWWGSATVAIESGLRGPRERGAVKIVMQLPSLTELTVLDHSYGKVKWPGQSAFLRVGEQSSVELEMTGRALRVETSWLSTVQLSGAVDSLQAGLRHQARIDAQKLKTTVSDVTLDEESTYEAGPGTLSGLARHGSRVIAPAGQNLDAVTFKEDSLAVFRN